MNIPTCEEFIRGCKEFERREKRDAMYKVATFLISTSWGKPSDITDGLGVLLLTWNQAFYRYGGFNFDSLEKCITDNFHKIDDFRKKDISDLSQTDEPGIKDMFIKFLKALQIDTISFSEKNEKRDTKSDLENFLNKADIKYDNSDDLKALYNSIKNDKKIENAVEFVTTSKKNYIEIEISKLGSTEVEVLESLRLIKRSPVAVAKALHLLAPNFFPLWDDKIAKAYECYYDEEPDEKYVSFCWEMKEVADKVKNYISQTDKTLKLIDEYNYSKYTKGWI